MTQILNDITSVIGWIVIVGVSFFIVVWLSFIFYVRIDRWLQKRKTNKYTYDDMFDAYMAGIEKIDPYHKAQNPAWFTLLGSEFIVFMKKIKK